MLFKKYIIDIPADVPSDMEAEFSTNYAAITKKTNHLFMLACDQKMEHLNNDFYGTDIHPDALHAEHIFNIAKQGYIGALATNLGLIARYGKKYPKIPYIAKLNGKTDLVQVLQKDPYSKQLWTVADAVALKEEHEINICGVGYTLYLGSEYESEMLSQAARIINDAHRNGLVTIIWIYARGKSIKDDETGQLIAGAAGLAATLGSDFVKVKPPHESDNLSSHQWLKIAAAAAGNTKVICAGGKKVSPELLLKTIEEQITQGSTAGCAIGRNIFQHSLTEAVAITKAIGSVVYDNKSVEQALKYVQGKK